MFFLKKKKRCSVNLCDRELGLLLSSIEHGNLLSRRNYSKVLSSFHDVGKSSVELDEINLDMENLEAKLKKEFLKRLK